MPKTKAQTTIPGAGPVGQTQRCKQKAEAQRGSVPAGEDLKLPWESPVPPSVRAARAGRGWGGRACAGDCGGARDLEGPLGPRQHVTTTSIQP